MLSVTSYNHNMPSMFALQLAVVYNVSCDNWYEDVKNYLKFSVEECRKKHFMASSAEEDICASDQRVSLLCPLTKSRIRVPGISKSCSHLQCFDFLFFLQFYKDRHSWFCPICNKIMTISDLRIDEYDCFIISDFLLKLLLLLPQRKNQFSSLLLENES